MSGLSPMNGSPHVREARDCVVSDRVREVRDCVASGRARALPAVIVGMLALAASSCRLPAIDIGSVDFALVEAGSYEGYWDGDMVKARVAVSADAGYVTGITILKHECGMGSPAGAVVARVVERQSLQVDTVTGATYSSRVILRAIENALTGR